MIQRRVVQDLSLNRGFASCVAIRVPERVLPPCSTTGRNIPRPYLPCLIPWKRDSFTNIGQRAVSHPLKARYAFTLVQGRRFSLWFCPWLIFCQDSKRLPCLFMVRPFGQVSKCNLLLASSFDLCLFLVTYQQMMLPSPQKDKPREGCQGSSFVEVTPLARKQCDIGTNQ